MYLIAQSFKLEVAVQFKLFSFPFLLVQIHHLKCSLEAAKHFVCSKAPSSIYFTKSLSSRPNLLLYQRLDRNQQEYLLDLNFKQLKTLRESLPVRDNFASGYNYESQQKDRFEKVLTEALKQSFIIRSTTQLIRKQQKERPFGELLLVAQMRC